MVLSYLLWGYYEVCYLNKYVSRLYFIKITSFIIINHEMITIINILQYFLRIPADNDDFRNRGTNWKMLFYFKSFKSSQSSPLAFQVWSYILCLRFEKYWQESEAAPLCHRWSPGPRERIRKSTEIRNTNYLLYFTIWLELWNNKTTICIPL